MEHFVFAISVKFAALYENKAPGALLYADGSRWVFHITLLETARLAAVLMAVHLLWLGPSFINVMLWSFAHQITKC